MSSSYESQGLRAQLIRAAQGSMLLRVFALGATMATSIVLARTLGPEAFGTYSFVFAIVTLLALPSQVGIPTLLVRETARAQAERSWAVLKGLWTWSTRTILMTSGALALAAFAVISLVGTRISNDLRLTLVAGMVLVPLIALGNARGAALRGLRLIVRGQLPETIIRPSLLIAFTWSLWIVSGKVSAPAAMALHGISAAIAFAIGGVILWRSSPRELASIWSDTSQSSAWIRAAVPLALISGLQIAGSQAGLILLGIFRPEADVGVYKVAASAATLALFGLQTANLVIAPHIARLHALGDKFRLQRLAAIGSLASGILTAPAVLVFVFFGNRLIELLYGVGYADAYWPLLLLGGAQLINGLFGSVGLLLNMTGHEQDAVRWLAISAGCNVLLGIALVPGFGMVGAACASGISTVIWNLAFWRIARSKLGIDGSIFAAIRSGWR